MTKISSDDLEQAAMWLEECDPSEASVDMRDSCIRVAAWLRQEAERRAARKIVNLTSSRP